jgi:pimeloyl-ACP methyl ester carboxylesterase
VDDLLRFAQTTGLWPRHLLGHSLGGKVLLQLASRPDDVRRLQQHSGGGGASAAGELTLGVLDSTPGPGIAASRAGFSARAANPGRHARTAIASATGSTISSPTSTILRVGAAISAPAPRKCCSDHCTTSGSHSSASRLFTAVNVMFSATSP